MSYLIAYIFGDYEINFIAFNYVSLTVKTNQINAAIILAVQL